MATIQAERLEQLRTELRNGSISYGELAEMQALTPYIQDGDVELLEAVGVPEHAPPRQDILSRVPKLTLELHGPEGDATSFWCVTEFWDCECDGNGRAYIHLKELCTDCPTCDSEHEERPDSRLMEVLETYPELYDVPWYTFAGEEVDKGFAKYQMAEHAAHCAKIWDNLS